MKMQDATPVTVRIGLLPTYRFRYSDWDRRLHGAAHEVLRAIPGITLVELPAAPAGAEPDPSTGAVGFGCVHTLDEAEVAATYLQGQGVQGLIVLPLDFGDERSVAKVAERLRVPILLFATKEPPKDANGRVSDSYCGTLAISAALHRRGLKFRFGGVVFADDAEFRSEAETFVRTVAVISGVRGARLGQIGVRPTQFESVMCNDAALAAKFGINVLTADVGDISVAANKYDETDPQLLTVLASLRGSVARMEADEGMLMRLARVELAVAEFARSERIVALAMRCWPSLGLLHQTRGCAIYGHLTAQGLPLACEADVVGALSMLVSLRSALGAAVPHLVDWTIQHRTNPNYLLAWHCGNAPQCLAADPDKTRMDREGMLDFQVKPGEVTFNRLMEYDGQWKMLVTRGRVVPCEESAGEGGTWSWVEVRDHAHLYRTLIEQGFIHHASMMHGDQTAALVEACRFLEVEAVVVE
jgi:L-fucose isomerase-like protein